MSKYTEEKLQEVFRLHQLWLNNAKEGVRANLEDANLEGANLEGANLEGANLEGANLEDANLKGANLEGAKLRWAILRNANLEGANLEGANLEGANLRNANLRNANLRNANLRNAKLRNAKLRWAILRNATGNNREIKTLQLGTYLVNFTSDVLYVGCQSMLIGDLDSITGRILENMDGQDAVDWWAKWGEIIKMILEKDEV